MSNIIETVKSFIGETLVKKASEHLGESESSVSKALQGAIPSILAGLLSKSATSSSGSSGIFDLIKSAAGSGILNKLDGLLDADHLTNTESGTGATIWSWIKSIFGHRANNIVNAISGFADINNSSASSLLSLAVPAVFSSVNKEIEDKNITASGLGTWLSSKKTEILGAIPSGLNLSHALGVEDLNLLGSTGIDEPAANIPAHVSHEAADDEKVSTAGKWLWPLLLLLALAALIYFLSKKGCNPDGSAGGDATTEHGDGHDTTTGNNTHVDNTVTLTGKLDTLSGDFVYDEGDTVTIELPNNAGNVKVGKYSTEAALYHFLNDPNSVLDTVKGNWFDFTNVRFETGKSTILPSSLKQLENLVKIANGFPTAQFKIGGYTDNTGNPANNLALSKTRAGVVAAKVKELGGSANSFISHEGYGQEHPVASNDTPEGRAQNRRVSVNVKAK